MFRQWLRVATLSALAGSLSAVRYSDPPYPVGVLLSTSAPAWPTLSHLNFAVAADATLYAAVKVTYDTAGFTASRRRSRPAALKNSATAFKDEN